MSERHNVGVDLINAIRNFFRDRFDLEEDQASENETIEYIRKGVEFRGTNLWILMFAIMVASIGLNRDSTAVIIGAMLISPLMGPIMGVGLGMGINDFSLLLKSLKNLLIAVVISILVSALYFLLDPYDNPQSELLSRTQPAAWDVLIGFFGGLAGIVAGSRKEKSNAIPGVAIATALMPPLCTAGYGLARGNWDFFFGAFYLFVINSIFISIATWIIVRYLNYPKKEFLDNKTERRARIGILFFTLIIIIPSIYSAFRIVQKSLFESHARQFVNTEFNFEKTNVISDHFQYNEDTNHMVEIFLFGEELPENIIDQIESKLDFYDLKNTDLVIHQNNNQGNPEEYLTQIEQMTQQYTTGIIQDLYRKNELALEDRERQIELLEEEVLSLSSRQYPVNDIAKEIKAINTDIISLSLSEAIQVRADSMSTRDTLCVALISFDKRVSSNDLKTLESFLKERTKSKKLQLVPVY